MNVEEERSGLGAGMTTGFMEEGGCYFQLGNREKESMSPVEACHGDP